MTERLSTARSVKQQVLAKHGFRLTVQYLQSMLYFGSGSTYESHVAQMAPTVRELALLEAQVQHNFLKQRLNRVR